MREESVTLLSHLPRGKSNELKITVEKTVVTICKSFVQLHCNGSKKPVHGFVQMMSIWEKSAIHYNHKLKTLSSFILQWHKEEYLG